MYVTTANEKGNYCTTLPVTRTMDTVQCLETSLLLGDEQPPQIQPIEGKDGPGRVKDRFLQCLTIRIECVYSKIFLPQTLGGSSPSTP